MNFNNRKNKPVLFIASLLLLLTTTVSTVHAQEWLDRARDRQDQRYNDRQELLDRVEDRYDEELDSIDEEQNGNNESNENNETQPEEATESESQSDEKCSVEQVLKMKDAGLSTEQIESACE